MRGPINIPVRICICFSNNNSKLLTARICLANTQVPGVYDVIEHIAGDPNLRRTFKILQELTVSRNCWISVVEKTSVRDASQGSSAASVKTPTLPT
jgi:hypothetical protein